MAFSLNKPAAVCYFHSVNDYSAKRTKKLTGPPTPLSVISVMMEFPGMKDWMP
jgi:hypothetical protein